MTSDPTCLLGYYFAREKGTSNITCIAGWGDIVEKDTSSDIEILCKIPPKVVEQAKNGVKILNLKNMISFKTRT